MNIVDKIFKEKTNDITFLELKENTFIEINNYILKSGIPLPVITNSLITDIRDGNLEDEINLLKVVEGIIYLIGVDTEFQYLDKYKEILNAYDPNIKDYIFYKGMKALEEGDLDNSGIYFRALISIDPSNTNARFNYALVLEEMGKRYIAKDKIDDGEEILLNSTNELEDILKIDEGYSLAYYKLGYHYKYNEQYLKTKLTWNKFLILDKDENRLQEIREEIDAIEDNVKFEAGVTYLSYNEFNKALDSFLKLLPKYKDNWNANYLISMCYKGIDEIDKAIYYLNKAIELNKTEADLYNELGIIYFVKDNIAEAVNIFTEGIDNIEDYKLYFNRGLGYIQLGQYNYALKDINRAFELNPFDENIKLQKEELEDLLKKI